MLIEKTNSMVINNVKFGGRFIGLLYYFSRTKRK